MITIFEYYKNNYKLKINIMKNIIKFLTVSVFLLTAFISYGQNKSAGNNSFSLYQYRHAENIDCTIIRFNIEQHCYARVYVVDFTDFRTEMLVEGNIGAGEHGVVYKPEVQDYSNGNYKCYLEAYDSNGKLIHISRIELK